MHVSVYENCKENPAEDEIRWIFTLQILFYQQPQLQQQKRGILNFLPIILWQKLKTRHMEHNFQLLSFAELYTYILGHVYCLYIRIHISNCVLLA